MPDAGENSQTHPALDLPIENLPGQNLVTICGLSILVGVIAGFGAWIFRLLIGLFHNLLFLSKFSLEYNANEHTAPSPWGVGVILVPVIGALIVVYLVKTFAPEAKGHGVPEVIDAVYYGNGKIRPVVAVIKSVASALCIGSGGSVGREGPIIQIGAAFGSTLGLLFKLPPRQRITLIAAGAGGGIAATFNAPLGGVIFAIELLLVSINARNVLPVSLATVVASYIGRWLIGGEPSFEFGELEVPNFHLSSPWLMLTFVPFGIVIGLVSWMFVRGIYWAEDRFDAIPVNDYVRHAGAMALVGCMMYLLMQFAGHYYVQGVGYATIMDLITGTQVPATGFQFLPAALIQPGFLILLFVLKFAATCLTLGSGGSGGVFSPGLFLGAIVGSLFALLVKLILPEEEMTPAVFVLAGMAAMIGSSTGAILTGAVMLLEMTRDFNVTLPIIVTSTVAYGIRKWLSSDSIYTLKLTRRGHVTPQGLQSAFAEAHTAGNVMDKKFRVLAADEPWTDYNGVTLVVEAEKIVNVITADQHERVENKFIFIAVDASMIETLREMDAADALCALVVKTPGAERITDVEGVVTQRQIAVLHHKTAHLL